MSKQERKNAAKAIADSAHKIWLAGLGAFAKAQAEGTRAFEQLMRDGAALEQQTRKYTKTRLDEMRDRFEKTTERLRKTGESSMERMQSLIDERIAKAVERMAVPTREELDQIMDDMTRLNRRIYGTDEAPATSAKPAAKRAAPSAKRTARKAAAGSAKKKAAKTAPPAKKSAAKSARKSTSK